MKKLQEVLHDGSDYKIDLVKLIGKPVRAITGYLSREFGHDPSFKLCEIIFEDGTSLGVEGEHDFPYVVEYGTEPHPNFDGETLESLASESE